MDEAARGNLLRGREDLRQSPPRTWGYWSHDEGRWNGEDRTLIGDDRRGEDGDGSMRKRSGDEAGTCCDAVARIPGMPLGDAFWRRRLQPAA
eukprot:749069-Amorphochlora_amoeboformis.AAC.2